MIAALLLATAFATPRDVVVELYREYAWEAVVDEPSVGKGFLDQSAAELHRFLDDRLVSLILEDRQCEEKGQGVCNLDFDPLWDSQDPGAYALKIRPQTNGGIVRVEFRLPGCAANIPHPELARTKTTIDYYVRKTPNGWRIGDIRFESGDSLVKILSSTP